MSGTSKPVALETGISFEAAVTISAGVGYLLGSIPFGLVLTRMAGFGDIRQVGSGNIGATNVLRTGNKFLAFLTLIGDSGKGAAAALVATYLWGAEAGMVAGLAGVIGHNFPVWLGFKGGKGVATTLGVLLVVNFMVGLATCAVWLVIAGTFRYSSLAALVALASSAGFSYWIDGQNMAWMAGVLALLSIVRHKDNMKRLLSGKESKIGNKNPASATDLDTSKQDDVN